MDRMVDRGVLPGNMLLLVQGLLLLCSAQNDGVVWHGGISATICGEDYVAHLLPEKLLPAGLRERRNLLTRCADGFPRSGPGRLWATHIP